MPLIRMHRSEMSHKILFALEVLLTGQARLRQQRPHVVIEEDLCCSIRFHGLHDHAVRGELLIGQLCPVLKRSMVLTHVLLESMLCQVHLAALVAGESDL